MTQPSVQAPAPRRPAATNERDRKTRQRRAARFEAMRSTVSALERAVPVMLTLNDIDDDIQWEGFLDAKAVRVRSLMRQTLELTKEAQALQASQRQLQRLLREHRLASLVLSGLLGAQRTDDWEADLQRWRQLTHKYFTPWTLWDCADEIDDALKEINALLWNPDAQSTDVSFHGWRERRVTDPATRSLKFVFHKECSGYPMMAFVHGLWILYTNADMMRNMRGVTRRSVEIVQQLSPTMCIIRSDERFPTFDAHLLYLLFRVEAEGGFILCVRTIHDSHLQAAISGPSNVWVTNNIWYKSESRSGDLNNFRADVGGSLVGMDIGNANRWLVEVLVSLVRGEAMITRRPHLAIENTSIEDGEPPTTPASESPTTATPLASSYVLWQRQVRADLK